MINRRAQQGFTLIELIIVIAILSVLLLGLLNLFDWHQKVYVLEQADIRATSSARSALNSMTRYIAQGYEVEASRTINGTTYTTGTTTLVVEIPSVNSGGNYIANTYDYVVYYLDNGSLYQRVEIGTGSVRPSGTKLLAENVYAFTLTYNNGDATAASAVTVDLETRVTTRSPSYVSAHITDTIILRNR